MLMGLMPCKCEAGVMRQFYVSVSGDDGGDGSETQPFKTVQAARYMHKITQQRVNK